MKDYIRDTNARARRQRRPTMPLPPQGEPASPALDRWLLRQAVEAALVTEILGARGAL